MKKSLYVLIGGIIFIIYTFPPPEERPDLRLPKLRLRRTTSYDLTPFRFEPGSSDSVWKIVQDIAGQFDVSPQKSEHFKRFVFAILKHESGLGHNQGSTPAYRYFQRKGDEANMRALRRIASETGMSMETIRSSHRGCVGISQSLPINYFTFGKDWDGDGKIDLFRSMPDATGFTANYLVEHGYRQNPEKAVRLYHASPKVAYKRPTDLYLRSVKRLAGIK